MDFFDLVDISERFMELVNPSTPEKMLTVGRFLQLKEGDRVIDFGCGFGEALALWGEEYGITGIGIDIRPNACERARSKMSSHGLADQAGQADKIQIVCGSASEYAFEEHAFDAAVCIGASFIWGGYQGTIRALKRAIRSGGRLAIGEPYWLTDNVPPEYAQQEKSILPEAELLRITRQEGFELEYVVRASHDDWDRYEADNWHGLIRWLEENPGHPERQQVVEWLHRTQDEYLRYGRQYLGWAVYVLAPASRST